MQKAWTDDAWADYVYWQTQDKKTLKRINNLLKDIDRQPFSRHIDEANRIIYKVEQNQIVIVQCGGHYGD